MNPYEAIFRLLVAHAVGDFALQSQNMALYKNKDRKVPEELYNPGQKYEPHIWFFYLTAHALIMGACVWLVTGQWHLGAWEVGYHWAIDYGKTQNKYGVLVDQVLHMLYKIPIFLWMWMST